MNRTLLAGLAGAALALAGTATAVADSVTVRVEGATSTLVKAVDIDPSAVGPISKGGSQSCDGNSGAGALELATGGNWTGAYYDGYGLAVDRILGEDYPFDSGKYWSIYLNDVSSSVGVCGYVPQDGDELLFSAECGSATSGCSTGGVLDASGGAVAQLGQPYPVTVVGTTTQFDSNGSVTGSTTTPADGATITGGGATGTTGADGIGRVTLTQRGPVELVVTRAQQVRDEVSTCVTDGADGYCGTVGPDGTTLPPEIGGSAGPAAGATKDTAAPRAAITSIGEGQRFSRRKAPRRLEATASDPSGLLQVKLSLTRRVGQRCSYFSGKSERFRATKCGTRHPFKVGDRGEISYLLPAKLGKGRYVFDVLATDKAYNRDTLARGRNRVVFVVR